MWTLAGNAWRSSSRALGLAQPVSQSIGKFGPFLLDGEFAFSDFANWGGGHNRGFDACVEASRGKTCVFDVGAHIGLVTLPMSSALAEGGRVFAFEPAVANLGYLRRHLALNGIGNVEVVEALVGSEVCDGVAFYEQPRAAGQNSQVIKKNPKAYRETRRRQVTLDGFCRERDIAPDLIKIDVEGAEIGVLEGARDVLTRHRPVVFLSVHPVEIGLMGRSLEDLKRLIVEFGYECREIGGAPVTSFRLDEYVLAPVNKGRNPS
ncbi:MAG: FkbM family methyltransferase [Pseudomonadota bacterium]|nr:FkbM family methyltransferase [Pseudomonadota bacterium]